MDCRLEGILRAYCVALEVKARLLDCVSLLASPHASLGVSNDEAPGHRKRISVDELKNKLRD